MFFPILHPTVQIWKLNDLSYRLVICCLIRSGRFGALRHESLLCLFSPYNAWRNFIPFWSKFALNITWNTSRVFDRNLLHMLKILFLKSTSVTTLIFISRDCKCRAFVLVTLSWFLLLRSFAIYSFRLFLVTVSFSINIIELSFKNWFPISTRYIIS